MGLQVNDVIDMFGASKSSFDQRRKALKIYYKYYRMQFPVSVEDEAFNKYFHPAAFEKVNFISAYLSAKDPAILIKAFSEDTDSDNIQKWQEYQYYCQDMDVKKLDIVKYLTITGNAALYHYFDKRKRNSPYRDKNNKLIINKQTVYDDPNCSVINVIEDFFPDPSGWDIQSCHYVILREIVKINDIQRLVDSGEITNAPEIKKLRNFYEDKSVSKKARLEEIFKDNFKDEYAKENSVELLRCFTDDEYSIVANREFLLDNRENIWGEKPFTWFKLDNLPHELYSIGIPESLEHLLAEMNTIRRAGLDNIKEALKERKFIANRNVMLDLSSWSNGEQVATCSGNPNEQILPLMPPDMEKLGIITAQQILSDIERVTITDFIQGYGSASLSSDTATTSKLSQANGMLKLNDWVDKYSMGLKSWMEWNTKLAKAFYPPTRKFKFYKETEFVMGEMSQAELLGGIKYQIKSAQALPISKDEEAGIASLIFTALKGSPNVKQKELELYLAKANKVDQISKLFKTDAEIAMEQIQQMAMMEQQRESQTEDMMLQNSMKNQLGAEKPNENEVVI